MNRRGFLGTLLASVAALTVDPQALLWQPTADLALPAVTPEALLTLAQITRAIAMGVGKQIQGQMVPLSRIGEGPLTRQINVCMAAPVTVDAFGLDRERYLTPTIEAFVGRLQRERAGFFGELPLTPYSLQGARVRHEPSGVCVRGLMIPNEMPYHGVSENLLRFDMVYGKAA